MIELNGAMRHLFTMALSDPRNTSTRLFIKAFYSYYVKVRRDTP